jgi:hypothetical protein
MMDHLIISIKQIHAQTREQITIGEYKGSSQLVNACIRLKVIAKGASAQSFLKSDRDRYTTFLESLARDYLAAHPNVKSWDAFKVVSENRAVAKIFFDYGVKNSVFDNLGEQKSGHQSVERKRVTVEDLHEICVIRFNFTGSIVSFKRMIEDHFGSYAEYCITKGYELNQSKWDDREAAIRCAKKLGSLEEIRDRSASLYKFIVDNDLQDVVINRKTA